MADVLSMVMAGQNAIMIEGQLIADCETRLGQPQVAGEVEHIFYNTYFWRSMHSFMILMVPIHTKILMTLLVSTPRPTAYTAYACCEDSANPEDLGCRQG